MNEESSVSETAFFDVYIHTLFEIHTEKQVRQHPYGVGRQQDQEQYRH